jgi:hypothetical protein
MEVIVIENRAGQIVDTSEQNDHVRLKLHDAVNNHRDMVVNSVSGFSGVINLDGEIVWCRLVQVVLQDSRDCVRIVQIQALSGAATNHEDAKFIGRFWHHQLVSAKPHAVGREVVWTFHAGQTILRLRNHTEIPRHL